MIKAYLRMLNPITVSSFCVGGALGFPVVLKILRYLKQHRSLPKPTKRKWKRTEPLRPRQSDSPSPASVQLRRKSSIRGLKYLLTPRQDTFSSGKDSRYRWRNVAGTSNYWSHSLFNDPPSHLSYGSSSASERSGPRDVTKLSRISDRNCVTRLSSRVNKSQNTDQAQHLSNHSLTDMNTKDIHDIICTTCRQKSPDAELLSKISSTLEGCPNINWVEFLANLDAKEEERKANTVYGFCKITPGTKVNAESLKRAASLVQDGPDLNFDWQAYLERQEHRRMGWRASMALQNKDGSTISSKVQTTQSDEDEQTLERLVKQEVEARRPKSRSDGKQQESQDPTPNLDSQSLPSTSYQPAAIYEHGAFGGGIDRLGNTLVAQTLAESDCEFDPYGNATPETGDIEITMSGAVHGDDNLILNNLHRAKRFILPQNDNVICNMAQSLDFDARVQPWRLIRGTSIPSSIFFDAGRAAQMLCRKLPPANPRLKLKDYFTTKTGMCKALQERQNMTHDIQEMMVQQQKATPQDWVQKMENWIDDGTITSLLRYGGIFPRGHICKDTVLQTNCWRCDDVVYPEDLIPIRRFEHDWTADEGEYWIELFGQAARFWNDTPLFRGLYGDLGAEYRFATEL